MLRADQADLQSAVKDGRLTKKQASEIESRLKQHIEDFVTHGFRAFGHDHDHDHDGNSSQSNQSTGRTPLSTPLGS